jgi:2,4-dienoyl-CoA reductase-like NADH-dependent reductase (Old Yellow Enzyme family)
MPVRYPRIASLKTADAFSEHLATSGIDLAFDATLDPPASSPLARPLRIGERRLSNRFAVLPMEGWDGTDTGEPSDLTRRRWRRFGESGAALIWGGEAVAVRNDGRANPQQLMLAPATAPHIAELATLLRTAHADRFGRRSADDLYLGLQLTHSGRFSKSRPDHVPEPLVAYRHPWLDRRFPGGVRVLSDEDLDRLCDQFVAAANLAWSIGFQFVDIKHCHGYLGHELLSACERSGRYGGSLDNRLTFLRTIVEGIRQTSPGLEVGVRLSAFDAPPYRPGPDGAGVAEIGRHEPYGCAFGRLDDDDMDATLADSRAVLARLRAMDIRLICITAGSPYYCPHIQRPALFPPSDGYDPPEDPLRGVARHLDAARRLKAVFPDLTMVGTGYSYLQEWLPHVAQHAVRAGHVDVVGLGRMMLAYPDLPADVLAGRALRRGSICRTFSDCTTGPRNGLVSGCYPLDRFYSAHPHHEQLKAAKARADC